MGAVLHGDDQGDWIGGPFQLYLLGYIVVVKQQVGGVEAIDEVSLGVLDGEWRNYKGDIGFDLSGGGIGEEDGGEGGSHWGD